MHAGLEMFENEAVVTYVQVL